MKYKHTKEELELYTKESLSIRQLCEKLSISQSGGNYKTLKNKIKNWEIDISHFTGSAWNVGKRYKPFGKKAKMEDILIKDSLYTSSNHLRKRLLSEDYKKHQCESCNNSIWLDKIIPLELHHINGINNDNRIENLKLLCPNCHAYTDNYRGKNMGI